MHRISTFISFVFLAAATLVAMPANAASNDEEADAPSSFERDRQAILDMAGKYDVGFRFWETVALKEGYDKRKPFEAGATELVKVVADEGDRIVLQRFLLVGDKDERAVVKHWRQEWRYEPEMMYVYRGGKTWVPRELSDKQATGKWAETVFQVDDSPRYAGLGEWTHSANISAWQSGKTWRPMPRREQKRDREYDVLVGRNRYTQTPTGWAHEQDNYKLVLKDGKPAEALVREVGLNTYERTDKVDFSPVHDYWQRTRPFWRQVNAAWDKVRAKGQPIHLKEKVDGKTLWQHMFERAGDIESAEAYDKQAGKQFVNKTIQRFLKDGGSAKTAAKDREGDGGGY